MILFAFCLPKPFVVVTRMALLSLEILEHWTLDTLCSQLAHKYSLMLPHQQDFREIGLSVINYEGKNYMQLLNQLFSTPSKEVTPIPITKLMITITNVQADQFTVLVEGLIHPNCRVTALDLTSSTWTPQVPYVLTELLDNENCKLETIRIWGDDFQPDDAVRLASTLAKNRIKRLELTHFPDAGWDELAKSILEPTCRLESLAICLPACCEKFSRFCDALSQRTCKLTQLHFTFSDWGLSLRRLAEVLPMSNIHTFSLEECIVDVTSLTQFVDCLPTWRHLKSLNLKTVEIPPPVHQILSAVLQCSIQLEKLSMPFCNVEDVAFVCTLLQTSGNLLRELNLTGNDLFDAGVTRLAKCLELETCKIQILNLSYVQAGELGMLALQRAMKSPNCCLVELDVNNSGLDDELEVGALERALYYLCMGRLLLTLHSPRVVPRIASHTCLRRLPIEMIRLVGDMM